MKTKTTIWNVEDHLKTKAARKAYLNAAFEDGDVSVIAAALGDIARVEGMSKVAKKPDLDGRAFIRLFLQTAILRFRR